MSEVAKIFMLVGTLLIILSGFVFMISANRSKRTARKLLFFGIIAAFLGGILPRLSSAWIASAWNFIQSLPLWITIIFGGLIVIAFLRVVVAIFLGREAANSFAGNLAATLFRGVFAVILAPFRLLQRIFGGSS